MMNPLAILTTQEWLLLMAVASFLAIFVILSLDACLIALSSEDPQKKPYQVPVFVLAIAFLIWAIAGPLLVMELWAHDEPKATHVLTRAVK